MHPPLILIHGRIRPGKYGGHIVALLVDGVAASKRYPLPRVEGAVSHGAPCSLPQIIYELRATIQHIGLSSQTARGGSFGRYNMRSCYVTFELEDGRTVELTAPEELCQNPVGTSGMLVYQGTKCEKFTPDD